MKNLNKFTKDELIKQYKKLEEQNNNKTLIIKIINYIIYFKGLILKLTLITLIIKWIRKYSLIQKLWHIFSIIGNTLLGFTLIDIYSWDFISWIKETSIYKWYFDLFSRTDKIETIENPSKFPKVMNERTSIETNGIQTESEINNRINRWFNNEKIINKEPEILNQEEFNSIEEKTNNYKYYFILGSLVIISGIIYYYWSDIRPAAGDAGNTIIEKIRSFRSWFNSDTNNIINNNPGNNTTNIPTNVNPSNEDIQLIDNTNPPNYESINKKGKAVLTSPSLENLNEQAETSWNSGVSSPNSDDSTETITQESISKISDSNVFSSSLINISNWRGKFTDEVKSKINFIESCFNSENNLNLENGLKLSDYYAFIINEYNNEIQIYNFMKTSSIYNKEDLNNMKESIYYFREWIAEYQTKIFPDSTVTIEIGSINDSPKILNKNIV